MTADSRGLLGLALRARWLLFVSWLLLWTVPVLSNSGGDWHYLRDGARHLFGSQGVHLYARDPGLQIGPPAFVLAEVFRPLGPDGGKIVAELAMVFSALVVLYVLERVFRDRAGRSTPTLILTSGLLLVPMWAEVSVGSAHLDDVLAVVAAMSAVAATARGRYSTAAILAGTAAAAKPWGIGVLALCLAAPTVRARVRAGVFAASVLALAWAPFVLGDTRTIGQLAGVHLGIAKDSGLALLGLSGTAPGWTRPTQFLVSLICASMAVRRGRWAAVPFVAFAVRVAFDPQTVTYYGSSVAMAAIACDLALSRGRVPVWTLLTFLALYDVNYLTPDSALRGAIRAAFCLAVIACTSVRWKALASLGRDVSWETSTA